MAAEYGDLAALLAPSTGTAHGGEVCREVFDFLSGYGTVFKLTPPPVGKTVWTEEVLYRVADTNGAFPSSGLIMDASGALYGTANPSRALSDTVFKLVR